MLNYKSKDGYFDIIEENVGTEIVVTHLFSTPIFDIVDFYTQTTFNSNGDLVYYKNKLGDEINYYEKPITPPRLFIRNKNVSN